MLTIIGDVHQKHYRYLNLIKGYDYTVQLGDFGFNYIILNNVDNNKHKFFKGNHDLHNLDDKTIPHCLGRFGHTNHGGLDFFFVSGGFSIDIKYRKFGLDWFYNEELNYDEMERCKECYLKVQPKLVITHEPPVCFKKYLTTDSSDRLLKQCGFPMDFNSNTGMFLQDLLESHQPDLYICGHFHKSMTKKIPNVGHTKFVCLDELETLTIDDNYQILY